MDTFQVVLEKIKDLPLKDNVRFTPREYEVVQYISLGLTSDQIAEELHVVPNTIKFHITKIHEKLGTKNRVMVTLWYYYSIGHFI